jgi:hypothetical protein
MINSTKIQTLVRFVLFSSIFLTACSGNQAPNNNDKVGSSNSCTVVAGEPSAEEIALATALKQTTETSPFYKVLSDKQGFTSCDLRFNPDGEIVLEYHFLDNNWLQVKRNKDIEYTEQNLRLNLQLTVQPETILSRAEQSAFGANGCGIDWLQSETQLAKDDPNVTETVFHGDVCNCQARIRRNAYGRVVGFLLRSAC